jgi:hypothetical protein
VHGVLLAASLLVQPVEVPPPPDPRELELVWRAPQRCPTRDEILRRIDVLLPGAPNGDGLLHVEGDVTVDESGARLQLVTTFRGTTERREITAADCHALGEATAVLLAVALEPNAGELASPTTPKPQAADPKPDPEPPDDTSVAPIEPAPVGSTIAPPLPRDRSTSTSTSTASPSHFGLRIAGGLELGAMPPPSGALQLAGLVLWRRARLEIHGAYLPPRTRRDADGRGATYQMITAGARGCGRLFVSAVEFPICLGAEAGLVRGRAVGLGDTVVRGPWFAVLTSAGVSRAWGPIAIWASVEGLGRVVWTRFLVGGEPVHRPFPISMRALVGIELRASWKRGGRGQ